MNQPEFNFDGDTYDAGRDKVRLSALAWRVWRAARPGEWYTLAELQEKAGGTEASVSARLRDFRKERFGSHSVDRRHVSNGLYEYRLTPNPDSPVLGPKVQG